MAILINLPLNPIHRAVDLSWPLKNMGLTTEAHHSVYADLIKYIIELEDKCVYLEELLQKSGAMTAAEQIMINNEGAVLTPYQHLTLGDLLEEH